mgnify:FL=1
MMTTYDLNEELHTLSAEGVLPEWDIPVETDHTSLVSVEMGLPMPPERLEMLKGKTIVWVPFICDDGEDDE